MGQISLQIPQVGLSDSTEDVKVANNFTTLQNTINGSLDSTNVSNALAQSAVVNTGTQTVKGAVNIATSESRTNVAYGTLTTPDQVTGIVLPTNGLIAVWYQATWQQSVASAARAAIFIGSNQLKAASGSVGDLNIQEATAGADTGGNSLTTSPVGLISGQTQAHAADVTTGQVVGVFPGTTSALIGGVNVSGAPGGVCFIFAAAGTYTVSIQFKASSGSVTASNRKLWVQALSFA